MPVHQNFGRSLFQNLHVGHAAEIRVRDSKDLEKTSGLNAIQLSTECLGAAKLCAGSTATGNQCTHPNCELCDEQ